MAVIRMDYSDKTGLPRPCIVQINWAAATLLGYDEKELIGQPLALIFATEKEMSLWQAAIAKLDKIGPDNCFEGEIITKGRHRVRVLLSISPLANPASNDNDIILLIQAIKPDNDLLMMHRVVEQSATAVMITDRNGRIDYVNPKFIEMTGYSSDELLGQTPKMLQSGKTGTEYYQAMWARLVKTGEWHGELQNLRKNGDVYWIYESISAIKNSAGDITHYLAVAEDITRRKKAESALSESEERFRQMAEMTGEWLWEQDPEGYYIYSSNAVKEILGFSHDEVIGKHYTEFMTTQAKETQDAFATSRQSFYAFINHYQHRNGHQVYTESTGLPITNTEGKLLKWRGVDRNITARIRFQNELIESEKRTRLIIESSMNAIVIMDSYGIITDWNKRAEKMFGWSNEEAIGQRLDELVIPQHFRHAHRQGLDRFLKTGAAPLLNIQTEQMALRRDGTEFPVELYVSPLKLGNAYIFSGFIHDITSRKESERLIRKAQVNLAIAQNEIRIAQQIQATLSPSAPIKADDFEVTGSCLTANKVGGDYFDYFFRKDTQLDMVIADVSGHSIGPALFMVEARSAIRAQTNLLATPSETLDVLNQFLFDDLDKSDYFITLFYLQYNIHTQHLRYANAGHPPPLLFSLYEGEFKKLDAEGLILGVRKNVVFEEKTTMLGAGDLILFYTDGLIEAENAHQEFFGLERVKAIVLENVSEPPQTIVDSLYDGLKQFCQRTEFADDITLMVFKCGG